MKKLWIGAILGALFLGGCAQNKEKREEFKDDRNKDSLRNKMGDSAVANSEPAPVSQDTAKVKTDSLKTK
jgi:PBP1b-binding outer membrane lipoprotein LpoB